MSDELSSSRARELGLLEAVRLSQSDSGNCKPRIAFREIAMSSSDNLYSFDDAKLDSVRNQKAWVNDPKYFKRVKISPSATIKMQMHCQSGVEKGIKLSGKPIEVMGLLLGRPDIDDPHAFVISDAQALPIEGFETRVVADDDNVLNYMIELGESNELSRKETFCGWYHSHPFDVDVNSHCYLSNTDITTQLQWQRSEDPKGNPFLSIVIDPLRSLAKGRPEIMSFRVYPPEYNPPLNQTPDGTFVTDDRIRVEKWGACWSRYYRLETSYFMSSLATSTLGILKNNFLWQNTFTSTRMLEPEHQQRISERVSHVCDKLEVFDTHGGGGLGFRSQMIGSKYADNDDSILAASSAVSTTSTTMSTTSQGSLELAVEQCQGIVSQLAKNALFGSSSV